MYLFSWNAKVINDLNEKCNWMKNETNSKIFQFFVCLFVGFSFNLVLWLFIPSITITPSHLARKQQQQLSLLSEWVKCVFVMFSMQQLKSSYENINMQMIIVLLFLSLVEYECVRGVCAWAIRISLLSSDCWNRASAFQSAECFYYGVMFSDFMFFFFFHLFAVRILSNEEMAKRKHNNNNNEKMRPLSESINTFCVILSLRVHQTQFHFEEYWIYKKKSTKVCHLTPSICAGFLSISLLAYLLFTFSLGFFVGRWFRQSLIDFIHTHTHMHTHA